MTRRRPHKKQNLIYIQIFIGMNNINKIFIDIRKKQEEKKPKRKQEIVQVDDLLIQKLITPITLGEYFPPEVVDRGMMTSTHMVSCHETSKEDGPSEDEESVIGIELSKTKEEDDVVANLQCLLSLFSIHELLKLPEETRIELIQTLKNPSFYATKIKGAKRFEDKCHNCATCCATITFTIDDEESMTSNFTIIVLTPRHSNDPP